MPLLFVAAGPPGANIPAVTETVVATVSGVTLPRAGLSVALSYIGALLTGAGTTAVTIRCRRGVDTTGVIVPTTAVPTETAAARARRSPRSRIAAAEKARDVAVYAAAGFALRLT